MTNYPIPRGTRDFLPDEMNFRKEIIEKIERIFKAYGFNPIDVPVLEYLKALRAKCGEEVSGQIYEIEDMGLRFDLTIGLARLVSNTSLPKPFKAYNIGKVWRRDEPQAGRFREFLQMDADIIGSNSMKCEAELLSLVCDCLKEIKIKNFKIRLNNIKTLRDIIRKAGISENKIDSVMRSLDKLKKKGKEEVKEEMLQKDISESAIKEIFRLINSKSKEFDGIDELDQILSFSKEYGVKNIVLDYTLARGLGYYTGPVYEIEADAEIGSIGGGGRYDGLLSLYGSPSPAVGISFGIERIFEVLKPKSLEKTKTKIYIATVSDKAYPYAIKVAKELRKRGIAVSINLTERDLRKQLDYANSLSVPYVAIIGEKEVKEGKITLRDLKSGKEKLIKPSGLKIG